ncbi:MAG TPA: FtsX-like permease family protein, partial [Gammaproteobacteria bacterium]|nr:FtsX-like permease family protein [Gammaproteobacteria bacterium]
TIAVSAWNFRSMSGRLRPSAVAVAGFFGVVLVFVAVMSIQRGISAVLNNTGSDAVAIVSMNNGSLDGNALNVIGHVPGVNQGPNGPLMAGMFVTSAQIATRSSGLLGSVNFRGVGPEMPSVWPKFHIVQGRMFKPGLDEIVVGRQAERMFKGLSLGDVFKWNHHDWKVVGIFAMDGGIHESEIFTDVNQLQSAYNSVNQYSNTYVRLTSAEAFPAFKKALENNPQLGVNVVRESTNFQQSGGGLSTVITLIGGLITGLMAIGAIFGAINIMYSNIASRMQDIATLRALGFSSSPVLVAVILEGVILGLVGGIAASIIAYLIFNGYQASTLGNGAMMAFSFEVTPGLIMGALALSVFMGFIGGLFPAIRAARLPVATALRET